MGAASPRTNHELGTGMVLYVIRMPNLPISPTLSTPLFINPYLESYDLFIVPYLWVLGSMQTESLKIQFDRLPSTGKLN